MITVTLSKPPGTLPHPLQTSPDLIFILILSSRYYLHCLRDAETEAHRLWINFFKSTQLTNDRDKIKCFLSGPKEYTPVSGFLELGARILSTESQPVAFKLTVPQSRLRSFKNTNRWALPQEGESRVSGGMASKISISSELVRWFQCVARFEKP